jgi:hypothetical protein
MMGRLTRHLCAIDPTSDQSTFREIAAIGLLVPSFDMFKSVCCEGGLAATSLPSES